MRLFGVVRIGRIVTRRQEALDVASLVNCSTFLVGRVVPVQVDRRIADRAGELTFFRAMRLVTQA